MLFKIKEIIMIYIFFTLFKIKSFNRETNNCRVLFQYHVVLMEPLNV